VKTKESRRPCQFHNETGILRNRSST